ncbi:NAD-dependent epimerase/dehydratase family protein [Microlunatus ginsengisoli]|uniref:NAD-dependent epimerase/dehydratase family protein n=1 Tax=Microlunatus ginsengisoli TaxID=363863 RepID=A0ABP7AIG5_9ACTN
MKILVLGGTGFVGRALVEEAVGRRWSVTTFNRGQSGRDVPGVDVIRGDRYRDTDLITLAGTGQWDTVFDCSGYVPGNVLDVSRALSACTAGYVFVSTVSVYAGWPAEPLTEDSRLLEAPPDAGPDFGVDVEDGPTRYGYQKAGCEAAVRDVFGPERCTILRPGVVLGPREYVGRLVWWLARISKGGRVVAPGPADRAIQPVDVRDLATFALQCATANHVGDFNVTAPIRSSTFGDLLAHCMRVTSGDATLVWTDDEVLLRCGVRQWSELPLWRVSRGVWEVSSSRAEAVGLSTRPLAETVADTWAWMEGGGRIDGRDRAGEVGLSAERELQLLRCLDVRAGEP